MSNQHGPHCVKFLEEDTNDTETLAECEFLFFTSVVVRIIFLCLCLTLIYSSLYNSFKNISFRNLKKKSSWSPSAFVIDFWIQPPPRRLYFRSCPFVWDMGQGRRTFSCRSRQRGSMFFFCHSWTLWNRAFFDILLTHPLRLVFEKAEYLVYLFIT